MPIEACVYFSDSGQKRIFSFNDPASVTLKNLRERIKKEAPELLPPLPSLATTAANSDTSGSSNTSAGDWSVLLDSSGLELRESQAIDNATEFFYCTVAATKPPLTDYFIDTSPLQVPDSLSVPSVSPSSSSSSTSLQEYLKIFQRWGTVYVKLRREVEEHYRELHSRSSCMKTAFQKLHDRLCDADKDFNTSIERLRAQFDELRRQIDEFVPSIDADLLELKGTMLHSYHANSLKRDKLIDLLSYTPQNLHDRANSARTLIQPEHKKMEELMSDYKSKVKAKLETQTSVVQVLEAFSLLENVLSHVKSLLDELDTATDKNKRIVDQLLSMFSKGSPDPAPLLAVFAQSGTVDQLRRQAPPFTNSVIDKARDAQRYYLSFFLSVQDAIEERLGMLYEIKQLNNRKEIRNELFNRSHRQFSPIREVHYLRLAYEKTLAEVVRRHKFRAQLLADVGKHNERIQSLVNQETSARDQFASEYLELLNPWLSKFDLFPGIKDPLKFTPMTVDCFDERLSSIGCDDNLDQSWFDVDPPLDSPLRSRNTPTTTTTTSSNCMEPDCFGEDVSSTDSIRKPDDIFNRFDAQKNALESQIESLQMQLSEQNKRVEELAGATTKADSLQSQLVEMERQYHNEIEHIRQQHLDELQQLQQDHRNEVQRFQQQLDVQVEQIIGGQELMEAKSREIEATTARCNTLQAEHQTLHEQYERLQHSVEVAKQSLAKAEREFAEQIAAKTAESDSRNVEVVSSRKALAALKAQLEQVKDESGRVAAAKIEELNAQIAVLSANCETYKEHCEGLKSARDLYIEECKKLKEELSSLEKQLVDYSNLEKQHVVLTAQLSTAHQSISQLKLSVADEAAKRKKLEEEQDKLRTELSQSNQMIKWLREDCEKKQQETQAAITKARQSDEKCTISQNEILNLKAEISALNSQLEWLRQRTEQQHTEKEKKLKKDLQSTYDQLTEYRSNLDKSREELVAARKELEDTRAQLTNEIHRLRSSPPRSPQLDNAISELNATKQQLSRALADQERTRNELAQQQQLNIQQLNTQQQKLTNTESQLVKAHEQAQQAKSSLSICAGGLHEIAANLHLSVHANSMRGVEQGQSPAVNPQDVRAIVDEFVHFIQDTDRMSQELRAPNNTLDPRKITISLSDFMPGDKILFLPLPGCRSPAEQIFFAMCQDQTAPPSFLSSETLSLKAATNSNIRQASFLIGEFFIADSVAATPNNPYRLPVGTKFNVIQARLF